MLEGWSTDSCKTLFGQTILSDARAFQSPLKKCKYLTFRGQLLIYADFGSNIYFSQRQIS